MIVPFGNGGDTRPPPPARSVPLPARAPPAVLLRCASRSAFVSLFLSLSGARRRGAADFLRARLSHVDYSYARGTRSFLPRALLYYPFYGARVPSRPDKSAPRSFLSRRARQLRPGRGSAGAAMMRDEALIESSALMLPRKVCLGREGLRRAEVGGRELRERGIGEG